MPPSVRPRALLASALLSALVAACSGGAARDASSNAGPPRYTGELPCADCAGIATTLTLFPGDSFLIAETYKGTKEGDRNYTSRGVWSSMADAVDPSAGRIVYLSPNQGMPRRFRQLGDSALRQLDKDGKEFESSANITLSRVP
jgi:uncharacterized lipoprotein NlpE involved in copper resistance